MKLLLFCFSMLLLFAISCNDSSPTKSQVQEVAFIIPKAGFARCPHKDVEAYNLSLGSYAKRKGLKYYVANKPAFMDSTKASEIIDRAWEAWKEHIETPVIERINQRDSADLVIRFEKLDGAGGVLGQAEYPSVDTAHDWSRTILFDDYDLIGSTDGTAAFDFFTTAVHEFGHSLGLKHCDDRRAIMYYLYNGVKRTLMMDDVAGIRERYNPKDFTWNGRRYCYMTPDKKGKASANFTYKEYYTKCKYNTGHYIDSTVFVGVQSIRTHYQTPIKIISTFRTYECNAQAGGATMSQHLQNNAVDWKFMGRNAYAVNKRYQDDIKNRGVVFQKLFRDGIRGYGTYETSNHLDTRSSSNMMIWNGQFYTVWGKANEAAFLAPDYFGIEDCEN